MVGFSANLPVMDLKKLSLSDRLSSPRRKVVSGFGLGLVLSFIVLSVVLYNVSFKAPFPNPPVWSNAVSNGNSLFHSWPFSMATSSSRNATCCFNDASTVQKSQHPVTVNDTFEGKGRGSNKSSDLLNSDGENMVFEDAHVRNVSDDVKEGSFLVGDGNFEGKRGEKNGSQIDKSTMPVDGSGNSRKNVKNRSVGFEGENVSGNSIVKSVEDAHTSNGPELGDPENYGDNGDSGNKTMKALGDDGSSYKDCDIFNGRWVRDKSKPYYPPGSCPYLDRDFDCHLNGRPDNEYVKWRWQPYGCDIPSFNSTDFLERLRGQKLVFVGDSLNRNMWESLVCLLRHGVQDKKRVYEISGRHEFKKKGFYAFRFEDYNCSVDFVSSPFLVKESSFNGKNGSFETLRLDLMDKTTSMYRDADILIFNTGHWWTHEKTARGEDYYQEGNYVHPRLKVLEAYKRALATWARWVDRHIDRSKTLVIFRGYSVTHFRGGPWNSGGQCHKETEPIFNDNHLAKYPSKMKILQYVLKDMKTPVTYLNISRLTDYRKDAHPSVYRPDYQAAQQDVATVHTQDCSHWCLPGVPDTWNELLYVSLLTSGLGSWRN